MSDDLKLRDVMAEVGRMLAHTAEIIDRSLKGVPDSGPFGVKEMPEEDPPAPGRVHVPTDTEFPERPGPGTRSGAVISLDFSQAREMVDRALAERGLIPASGVPANQPGERYAVSIPNLLTAELEADDIHGAASEFVRRHCDTILDALPIGAETVRVLVEPMSGSTMPTPLFVSLTDFHATAGYPSMEPQKPEVVDREKFPAPNKADIEPHVEPKSSSYVDRRAEHEDEVHGVLDANPEPRDLYEARYDVDALGGATGGTVRVHREVGGSDFDAATALFVRFPSMETDDLDRVDVYGVDPSTGETGGKVRSFRQEDLALLVKRGRMERLDPVARANARKVPKEISEQAAKIPDSVAAAQLGQFIDVQKCEPTQALSMPKFGRAKDTAAQTDSIPE